MNQDAREKLFETFYSEYRHKVLRICHGYLYEKHDAQDLFQEIMINIWNNLHTFRGESGLGTWIYRIAVNSALLHNRKTSNYSSLKTHMTLMQDPAAGHETGEQQLTDQRLDQLSRAIAQLEKNDRLIIALVLEGLTYDHIAEVVGITPNYVGVKVNRIKKQLKKMMQHEQ